MDLSALRGSINIPLGCHLLLYLTISFYREKLKSVAHLNLSIFSFMCLPSVSFFYDKRNLSCFKSNSFALSFIYDFITFMKFQFLKTCFGACSMLGIFIFTWLSTDSVHL